MKGFGYALGRRWVDMTDDQRDLMLDGIVHDADRMDAIVRQLVDAAKVMSGRFEAYVELTDTGDLVGQIAEQQARDPEHPPIEWAGGADKALVDAGRLKTTIMAFVEALAWWGDEGPIRVGGAVRDGRLLVSASRGAGTATTDVDTLFEARRPGTGGGSKIGLYVARRVAEAQGGRAWGELTEGRLTFHVELPIAGRDSPTP
ncbi:MAG: HAMP domain-containing histidine kinase [Actinomycetota bacterium]|nr:HAMP domain-containing histidine kinase [Actinomycetota bacterium]